ncbi:winged helix DNA-binding domain-containing protein [Actinomycetospora cinnamomea]|uniref:Winged helix DNA-binding protein n=1 Tax=Actinomycetospora cinnamomea TaxID=663609 RepID=A0A2U1F8X7_9PSEU|nr:winged helix DNA-binding domain-containing protein [Actinomycetospora cinnamomea]PVZ08645.1 winged helix DNA-binding protein [Actinomycetospora cinnamomea]
MTVLDARALGRAALARQFLLARAEVPVLDAVAHLAGMQAQEPQEPYAGLWSRLAAFDPTELSALLTDRRVVRTHLMRRTVHLVTADDALAWRSRHDAMLVQRMLGVYRRTLGDTDLAALAADGAAALRDEPRTMPEVGRLLADRWPGLAPREIGDVLTSLVPLVQVPPRGVWGATAPARCVLAETWLGRPVDPPATGGDPVGEALVLRYLAVFGPAATADLRAWSGLAGLPGAVDAVRERLVASRDGRGRELLDLPDAPRPDPDTPAPVRFLPAFDNLVLGYDDRSRFVDDAHRGLSVSGARFVLVDGRVAATWSVEEGTVTVTPLRAFSRADRTDVGEEGRALAHFLSGGESRRVTIAASPR